MEAPSVAASVPAQHDNRRTAWIVGLVIVVLLLVVIGYFAVRRGRPDRPGSAYTPPPASEILPSGRYRIKWADFGFLTVWNAGALYKTTDLDPKATAANATVWTYDATNGTLATDTPESLVAIHYPSATTALIYLVAPQNVPQVPGASSRGWVLSGPPASINATNPTPSGRITNTEIRKDAAYQGLVVSSVFGVPQLVEQPAADAALNRQWAFFPVPPAGPAR
jgi:hypothetical protein